MENLMLYLCKSGLWIVLFWLIYWFFLRKETFFGFNRGFLLSGLFASFVLPFCQYRYVVETGFPTMIYVPEKAVLATGFSIDWILLAAAVYVLGTVIMLTQQLIGLHKIRQIIRKQKGNSNPDIRLIETDEIQSSFSFFGYIFMDKDLSLPEMEKKLILQHETAHVKQYHWIDLLSVQIVCCLQWFNPFIWLYLHAIKQNHEFLADRDVIRQGNSQAKYAAALINYTFKTPVFTLTNSFSYYNKFKRISMMKKNVSQPVRKFAVLLIIPAFAAFLWAFAKPEYTSSMTAPETVAQDTIRCLTSEKIEVVPQDTIFQAFSCPDTILIRKNSFQAQDTILEEKYYRKSADPLLIVNDKELPYPEIHTIKTDSIESVTVLKDTAAIKFGVRGKNGVVIVKMKPCDRD
jgi:hypothetical protein